MQTDPAGQQFQYLPEEPAKPGAGEQVGEAASKAAAQVKEALPDPAEVKEVAGKAAAQVKEALPDADQVKDVAGKAVAQVKEALPDADQVKDVAGKAVAQVKAALPDAEQIRDEFIQAAHRVQEILPDGDELRALLEKTIETVRTDPAIKEHIEAAAEIVAQRVEGTVGQGIDTVAEKAKTVVEKVGLEPLGYVAERIGEIAKEGVEELVEETKNKALH
jgi:type I site-specific restriction endonuclease